MLTQYLLATAPPGTAANNATISRKLPSEQWKGTIDLLLKLTQVRTETDLPELWHKWVNSNKKEFRAILQESFKATALSLGLPEPVATADFSTTVANLQFSSPFEDNLELGLQPFLVAYHSQKTMSEQASLNSVHDLLASGTPQLSDLWAIKAASKIWVPTKESQMVRTLKAFAVVLATILEQNSLVLFTL